MNQITPTRWLCTLLTLLVMGNAAVANATPLDALMIINELARTPVEATQDDHERWIEVGFVAYDEKRRLVVAVDREEDVEFFMTAMREGRRFGSLSLETTPETTAGDGAEQHYFHIELIEATISSIDFDATRTGAIVKIGTMHKVGAVTLKRGTF